MAYMLESSADWLKEGDNRLTILYDAFFRLTFVREGGILDPIVRKVAKGKKEQKKKNKNKEGKKRKKLVLFLSLSLSLSRR